MNISESPGTHAIRPFFWFILSLSCVLLLVSLLSSCNPQKSLQRKDTVAVNRVNAKAELQDIVAAEYLKRKPCVATIIKDTTYLIQNDTTFVEKKIYIPISKTKIIDTLIDGISVYADSNGITVKNLNETRVITKYKLQVKIDQSRVDRLLDSLYKKDKENAYLYGQKEQLTQKVSEYKKDGAKMMWFFIFSTAISIVLLIISIRGILTKIKLPSFIKIK